MALPASAQILRFAQDDGAVARGERVGRALAHVASLLFLKSSVKVVRHKNWEFSCGGLWKKTVGGGVENVPCRRFSSGHEAGECSVRRVPLRL